DLAPVLGTWTGLARYFTDAVSGDYIGTQQADEFFADYLDDRVTNGHRPDPVGGFPRHLRLRRRLDAAFTLAALHRGLTPNPGALRRGTARRADLQPVQFHAAGGARTRWLPRADSRRRSDQGRRVRREQRAARGRDAAPGVRLGAPSRSGRHTGPEAATQDRR